VVADQDRRIAAAPERAHAVEDAGGDLPVAHQVALAGDDLVVEIGREHQIALVLESAIAR
jgi:hypothetical protein